MVGTYDTVMNTNVVQVKRIGVLPLEDPCHEARYEETECRCKVKVLVNFGCHLPKRDVSSIMWKYA